MRHRELVLVIASLVVFMGVFACSGDDDASGTTDSAGQGANSGSGANGSGANSGQAGGLTLAAGGASSTGSSSGGDCGSMTATIRDFQESHPDFETFGGTQAFTGLVENQLGSDNKPVYAHPGGTAQTTGPAEFAQWYNDVQGVNQAFQFPLPLMETSPGQFVYDNSAFFPVDGMGFGNQGNPNNFHFTTELHTTFLYEGGEVFTFTGDDDLWLFINRQLAIDLGGLHPSLSDTVDLDMVSAALGITVGEVYPLDIFHAERHTDHSNFRIQTTIRCFQPNPN